MLLSLLVLLRDGLRATDAHTPEESFLGGMETLRESVNGQTLSRSWWMLLNLLMGTQMAWLNLTLQIG